MLLRAATKRARLPFAMRSMALSTTWRMPDAGGADRRDEDDGLRTDDPLQGALSLDDLQTLARAKLDTPLYEYLASGTDDEQTLQVRGIGVDTRHES